MNETSVFVSDVLKGRAALVTGGGSGIGAGIAKQLARQGAKVGLLGRTMTKLETVAAEIRSAGGEAQCYEADVRQYEKLDYAINHAAETFGGIDILVNSAAGNFLAPAAQLSANGFRSVIDIDLCGTFNASKAAFPHLSKNGGSIVNITATHSFVATPLQCHASAAKAGIEKLTRDLAFEWSGFGIRVNAVAPGPIEKTEGMARLAPGDVAATLARRLPLKRFGTIHEIAEAVTFLVSRSAAYITGTTIIVDGGAVLAGGGLFTGAFTS